MIPELPEGFQIGEEESNFTLQLGKDNWFTLYCSDTSTGRPPLILGRFHWVLVQNSEALSIIQKLIHNLVQAELDRRGEGGRITRELRIDEFNEKKEEGHGNTTKD